MVQVLPAEQFGVGFVDNAEAVMGMSEEAAIPKEIRNLIARFMSEV
jgi:hypothetical protein